MANLAIRGHATRGKEVIEILEMLGGKNNFYYDGTFKELIYTIGSELEIDVFNINSPSVKNDYIIFTLDEFLEKFPYKVGDKVKIKETGKDVIIDGMSWRNGCEVIYDTCYNNDCVSFYSAEELQPYKEETMGEIKIDIQVHYPKTYEECCEIMGIEYPVVGGKPDGLSASTYRIDEIRPFIYLLICRDAYWKIAGEEMGFGKPWEPDWNDGCYVIFTNGDGLIERDIQFGINAILAFPTEEMRDAFYENFKDLIEQCKELL